MQLNELHAFCVYGVLVSYAFVMRLFIACLQHNKKVDNVGLVPTNTYLTQIGHQNSQQSGCVSEVQK